MVDELYAESRDKVEVEEIGDIPDDFHYEIIGYEEIPVANIRANPDNPRPTFHLGDDDPGLKAMADSIRTQQQFLPGTVYELVGHYKRPDEPGQFMLLRGERRWRACRIGGVDTFRTGIARAPRSAAEEFAWLGNEEAFKEGWGLFFWLRYARDYAKLLGRPMTHSDVAVRTGLSRPQLQMGYNVFRLEPEVQALVAEYEEGVYLLRATGKTRGRFRGTLGGPLGAAAGVDTKEFSISKASEVWEIFELLREHFTDTCKDWDDVELQRILAAKNSSHDDLRSVKTMLRDNGSQLAPGQLAFLSTYLTDTSKHAAKNLLEATGNSDTRKLSKFVDKIDKLEDEAAKLLNSTQLGGSDEFLDDASRKLLRLSNTCDKLERKVTRIRGDR